MGLKVLKYSLFRVKGNKVVELDEIDQK
jgi:hypothetical protein